MPPVSFSWPGLAVGGVSGRRPVKGSHESPVEPATEIGACRFNLIGAKVLSACLFY